MSQLTPAEEIAKAQADYVNFDDNQKWIDEQNFQAKLAQFKEMQGNPEFILMYFFTQILNAGSNPSDTTDPKSSSEARQQENKLQEVAKELNYASAYRDTITEIKEQLELGNQGEGKGSPDLVAADIQALQTYMTTGWGPHAPAIFQDGDKTFKDAEDSISGVLIELKAHYNNDFYNLWQASSSKGDKDATNLIQTFTNATDTLFSAVGVQNNVLNTQMQDIEANYKSYLSIDTQGWKAFMSIDSTAIKNFTNN